MSIELTTGAKGEVFFRSHLASIFFVDSIVCDLAKRGITVSAKQFIDNITKCNIEGDFKLIDDTVIEVKTLTGAYNNVLIEYARGQYGDRQGWYQHCKDNRIEYIVWNRYRSASDEYPVYSLLVFFPALSAYIDRNMLDPAWLKSHKVKPLWQVDSLGRYDWFHNVRVDCGELFYTAGCVEKIAYLAPHELTISDILNRSSAPAWCGLVADPVRQKWK